MSQAGRHGWRNAVTKEGRTDGRKEGRKDCRSFLTWIRVLQGQTPPLASGSELPTSLCRAFPAPGQTHVDLIQCRKELPFGTRQCCNYSFSVSLTILRDLSFPANFQTVRQNAWQSPGVTSQAEGRGGVWRLWLWHLQAEWSHLTPVLYTSSDGTMG